MTLRHSLESFFDVQARNGRNILELLRGLQQDLPRDAGLRVEFDLATSVDSRGTLRCTAVPCGPGVVSSGEEYFLVEQASFAIFRGLLACLATQSQDVNGRSLNPYGDQGWLADPRDGALREITFKNSLGRYLFHLSPIRVSHPTIPARSQPTASGTHALTPA